MFGYEKLLVPTDFSSAADEALSYARELAERLGASQIHLLHTVPTGANPQQQSDARRQLERVWPLGQADDLTVSWEVAIGSPAGEIVAAAHRLEADLIEMGTHGRTGLAHMVMGSVAECVLRESPCPVLSVRRGSNLRVDADRVGQAARLISQSRTGCSRWMPMRLARK